MSDSIDEVRLVASLLRDWNFRVIEVDGWEHRGSGDLTTLARLEHHTAGSQSGGNTASLRIVTFGRPGLRNSLCRWYVARNGVIYLVARRRSWHAGNGRKGSNATLSGTEAENDGVGEPWGERSLEAQAAISAAEAIVFDLDPADDVWDHKEHAPDRKIDRTGINPSAWRHRVARAMRQGADAMPSAQEVADAVLNADVGGKPLRNRVHDADVLGQQNKRTLDDLHAAFADGAGKLRDYERDTRVMRVTFRAVASLLRKLALRSGEDPEWTVRHEAHVPEEVEA